MDSVSTPIAKLHFDESEKILHVKVLEGAVMDLANTEIHYQIINNIVGNKKYFALVDATNYFTMHKEAWRYASNREVSQNRIAAAHYNSSIANTLSTKFHLSVLQSSIPVRIFDSKDEAVNWLRSMAIH